MNEPGTFITVVDGKCDVIVVVVVVGAGGGGGGEDDGHCVLLKNKYVAITCLCF